MGLRVSEINRGESDMEDGMRGSILDQMCEECGCVPAEGEPHEDGCPNDEESEG